MDKMPLDDHHQLGYPQPNPYLQVHDDAMSGQKWRPYSINLDQYLKDQLDQWGSPDFRRFEYLEGDGLVIPYFDYDVHVDSEPSAQVIECHRSACEAALCGTFGQQVSFSFAQNVFMAARHGFDPRHGSWKVSFRFWVQGFKIRRLSLPGWIRGATPHFICDDKGHLGWDLSVYSSKRNMGIPGACKGVHGDFRTMEIATGARTPENLANYIIQNVKGTETELFAHGSKGPQGVQETKTRKKRSSRGHKEEPTSQKEQREAGVSKVDASEVDTHDLDPAGLRADMDPPHSTQDSEAEWALVRHILCEAGFTDPSRPKRKDAGYEFFANENKRRACICCDRTHDSNNWYALFMKDGRLDVRNYSRHCAGAIFGQIRPSAPHSSALLQSRPSTHTNTRTAVQHMGVFAHNHVVNSSEAHDHVVDCNGLRACPLSPPSQNVAREFTDPVLLSPAQAEAVTDTQVAKAGGVEEHPIQTSLIRWGFRAECIVVADDCVHVSQHMKRCPACRAAHASPSWIISQIVQQCYSLRNSEESCREKLISQRNETLMLIKDDPSADAAFAELFIEEHVGRVLGSKNGKLIHMFDGTRWIRLELREFEGRVQHWLMGVLRRLSVLLWQL